MKPPAARALALVPAIVIALFILPVTAGLIGTALPSFGIMPGAHDAQASLRPWRDLLAYPGFATSLALTLWTAIASTLLSLAAAIAITAVLTVRGRLSSLQGWLAPLLGMPHAAFAIGLAFLLAPSGWLVRLVSPWPSGLTLPPDIATIQDPLGLAMIACLVLKETPFLLLMTIAALGQLDHGRTLLVARTLGYRPLRAWMAFVLPQVIGELRLPLLAVLAYGLSTVEIALVLGPTTPPPLALLTLRLFADPDLALRDQAAAAALLQLVVILAVIGVWHAAARPLRRITTRHLEAGGRGRFERLLSLAGTSALWAITLPSAAVFILLGLWSFARTWRFPDTLPSVWSTATLERAWPLLGEPLATSLILAAGSTIIALGLAIGSLEREASSGRRATERVLALVYLPLVIPQIAFLFGVQILLLTAGIVGSLAAVLLMHALFVLPYLFLALRRTWLAFDPRLALQARLLGRGSAFVFWRIKLPVLLRPVLVAAAIGLAVSMALYLPTLFAGAGRVPTLATEAVALASGADRRLAAVFAFVLAVVPALGFAAALALPALLFRNRSGLRIP